jgi:predicted AlkP superfamily phosphohydrolase/phosphomutase
VIFRCYERLDEIIGEFMAKIDDDTTLMFMSDHGFGHAVTNFNIHNWLVEQGLLKLKLSTRKRIMLAQYRNLARWMGRLKLMGIVPLMRKHMPGGFRKATGAFRIGDAVDWSQTRVFAIDKALYVNLKGRDPQGIVEPGEEYEELRAELTDKLLAVKDPSTGEPMVEAVYKAEDVYWGRYADRGGDLVVRFRKGFRHWPRLAPGAPIITEEKVFCSYHHDHEDGFYAMAGPDVKAGHVGEWSIVDVSPTIMHLLGVPAPEDLDGKVMLTDFEEISDAVTRPVLVREPADNLDRLRSRIRRLKSAGRI